MSESCVSFKEKNKIYTSEELSKFTPQQYQDIESKMDLILLHQVSEQRCKYIGCKLQGCLARSKDTNKCLTLFRRFNYCKETEFKNVKYEYLLTGKQPIF